VKRSVKKIIAKLGYEIRRRRPTPDDLDAFDQQHRLLADIGSPLILDVGAHWGETTERYAALFPNGKIHAFEPFPESFAILARNVANLPRVSVHAMGFAEISQELMLNVNTSSATNSLLETHVWGTDVWGANLVETSGKISCTFTTLDLFLAESGIPHVDLLKLDVQGAEHSVLQGGACAFAAGAVDVVYMEIITLPTYKGQRRLADYLEFFERYRMQLYGIYDQSHCRGHLRQIDAIFVSEKYSFLPRGEG
jgi:FkbM family methyltransferase